MPEDGAASPLSCLIRQHLKDALFFDRLLTPGLCLDAVTRDLKNKTVVQILESNCSFCPSGVNSGCEGRRGGWFPEGGGGNSVAKQNQAFEDLLQKMQTAPRTCPA